MATHGEDLTRSRVAGLLLWQKRQGYRLSLDPVLLADFVRPGARDRVCDLGAGVGVIALLIARRWPGVSVVALELQTDLARLAGENFRANGLDERCAIVAGDLRLAPAIFRPGYFHRVVANPPFRARGSGRLPPHPGRAAARQELTATIEDFARAAAHLLRHGGSFDLVHLPERLPEIARVLGAHGLEMKTLRLVSSFPDGAPRLALISARKGGRPGLAVLPPLAIWERPGHYGHEVAAALVAPAPPLYYIPTRGD